MILFPLALASALIYIPGFRSFTDGYNLPKMAYLSILGVLVWLHFYKRASAKEQFSLPLGIPICLFLAFSIISLKNATNLQFGVTRILADFLSFSFFWYVALLPSEKIRSCLKLAPLLVVPAIILGILGWESQAWGTTFGNPEHGASILAAAGLLSIAFGFEKKIWWVLSPVFFIVLFLARDRSAIAGLLIGAAFWLFFRHRKHFYYGVLIGALFFASFFSQLTNYFEWTSSPRLETWSLALKHYPAHTLFGVGRGNWKIHALYFAHQGPAKQLVMYHQEAHNDYLELWFEAGWPTLAVFLYLLFQILWFRRGLKDPVEVALFISLVVTCVRAFFLFPFQLPAESAWFWTLGAAFWNFNVYPLRSNSSPDCNSVFRLDRPSPVG